MERNWTSCFLCVYDKDDFKCMARDETITTPVYGYCENCPYYITSREARQKILFALGLIRHIEE